MALKELDLEEQEKLDALKAWWKENARLLMERDILKKAAAFFAKQQQP